MSARKSKPTPTTKARKAQLSDIIADGAYADSVLQIPTPDGPVPWRVHARELSWMEQSEVSERHTKVITAGRGGDERRIVNQTAIMCELLDKMLDGPKCDPPLKQEEVRKLRGPVLQALVDHFGLGADARQEEEKGAGESVAP